MWTRKTSEFKFKKTTPKTVRCEDFGPKQSSMRDFSGFGFHAKRCAFSRAFRICNEIFGTASP